MPDQEAEIALYRIAAETPTDDTAQRRAAMLEKHPNRQAAVTALVRTPKGARPRDLRNRAISST